MTKIRDPTRDQQVRAAKHEVRVRLGLLVGGVLVFQGELAALTEGRVGDDEAQRPLVARGVLAHPLLERHHVEVDVGPHRREHLGADLGQLDGGPVDVLVTRVGQEAARRTELTHEPADAHARLERPDDAVVAGQLRQERAHEVRDLLRDRRRREVLVRQGEVAGHEAGRELVHDLLDREAAPPAVAEQSAALVGGHVLGPLGRHEPHRREVSPGPRRRGHRLRRADRPPLLASLEPRADEVDQHGPVADDVLIEVGPRDIGRQHALASAGGSDRTQGPLSSWRLPSACTGTSRPRCRCRSRTPRSRGRPVRSARSPTRGRVPPRRRGAAALRRDRRRRRHRGTGRGRRADPGGASRRRACSG
jgi:hypothetical protein